MKDASKMGLEHTSTNTLSVIAFPQETVNTADRECQTSFG